MKKLIPVLLLISLIIPSCTTQNRQGNNDDNLDLRDYSKRTVKLINGMGTLSIFLPAEIDTFFTFIQHEDYSCGNIQILRFSGKKYTIDNDSAYFHSIKIDSIYQFTVQQAICVGNVFGKNPKIDSNLLKNMKDQYLAQYRAPTFFKDGILKSHNRDFVFSESWNKESWNKRYNDTSKIACRLNAGTIVKNEWIAFNFDCLKKDTIDFMNRMLTSLKSIEIDSAQ